jgi:colanic acid biosynthesis glycosyl transferase WcaI
MWMPRRLTAAQRILSTLSFALSSMSAQPGRTRRADLVLVIQPTLFSVPFAALLSALLRRPVWLHVQDFELAAALGSGYLRSDGRLVRWAFRLEAWLLRRLDRVSTLGPQMDAHLAHCGVPPQRRAIVPNWVDCAQIRPLERASTFRARLGIAPEIPVALYSGTFGRKHGLELLIDVARALRGHRPLCFVLCGDGSEKPALQAAAADLDNIIWLDLQPIEQLNELLNLADIHLLPQQPEVAAAVLPSKLTGMLASGRPVVATAAPGSQLAEIVSSAGMALPTRDVAAFANALLRLSADAALRQRLGAVAREHALTHFGKQPILERFEAAMAVLCTERGRMPTPPAPLSSETFDK